MKNNDNLNIPLYVKQTQSTSEQNIEDLVIEVKDEQEKINIALEALFEKLKKIGMQI